MLLSNGVTYFPIEKNMINDASIPRLVQTMKGFVGLGCT